MKVIIAKPPVWHDLAGLGAIPENVNILTVTYQGPGGLRQLRTTGSGGFAFFDVGERISILEPRSVFDEFREIAERHYQHSIVPQRQFWGLRKLDPDIQPLYWDWLDRLFEPRPANDRVEALPFQWNSIVPRPRRRAARHGAYLRNFRKGIAA